MTIDQLVGVKGAPTNGRIHWNRLATVPALRGEEGSVRELVLHFEVAQLRA